MVSHRSKPAGDRDEGDVDIDERYWRAAILQKSYYRQEVGFDRYRWALRYGQLAHKRHHGMVAMNDLLVELANGWGKFGGPSGLSWEEARDAVMDSWRRADTLTGEAIANQAGFKTPPTFAEHGSRVPRNVDESNR